MRYCSVQILRAYKLTKLYIMLHTSFIRRYIVARVVSDRARVVRSKGKSATICLIKQKNVVDYTSRKCFASSRVAPPRLGALATQYPTHTPKNIIFWTSDPNNYCNELGSAKF
jgi:hypothetical protein